MDKTFKQTSLKDFFTTTKTNKMNTISSIEETIMISDDESDEKISDRNKNNKRPTVEYRTAKRIKKIEKNLQKFDLQEILHEMDSIISSDEDENVKISSVTTGEVQVKSELVKSESTFFDIVELDMNDTFVTKSLKDECKKTYLGEYTSNTGSITNNNNVKKQFVGKPVQELKNMIISKKDLNKSPASRKVLDPRDEKNVIGDLPRLEQGRVDHHVQYTKFFLNEVFQNSQFKLLFSEEQLDMYNKLLSLDEHSAKLCIRLFYRIDGWQRLDSLTNDHHLQFSKESLQESFEKLKECAFVDTDYLVENTSTLLNLLSRDELKEIAVKLKLKSGNKEKMISSIIDCTKRQKILHFNNSSMNDILRKKHLKQYLSNCFRLSTAFRDFLNRAVLLFSITERFLTISEFYFELLKLCQSTNNTFQRKIDTPKLFTSREEFSEYERCRFDYADLMNAIQNKENDKAMVIILRAFEKLKIFVETKCQRNPLLPSYLNKFSAVCCVISLVSAGIKVLKQELCKKSETSSTSAKGGKSLQKPSSCAKGGRKSVQTKPATSDTSEKGSDVQESIRSYLQICFHSDSLNADHVLLVLEYLLKQNIYKRHKRAEWLKEKVILLSKYKKDITQICTVIVDAIKNPEFKNCQLIQLYLSVEAKKLQKSQKVVNEFKSIFKTFTTETMDKWACRFPTQDVRAIEMSDTQPGSKKIYKLTNGTTGDICYPSVEQVAIQYYKNCNVIRYENGIAAEGRPIYALYDILFWEIIYEYYVPDTFISSFQTLPLDYFSRHFYQNRKDVIEKKLKYIKQAPVEELERLVSNTVKTRNLTDRGAFDPTLLGNILKCLNRDILVNILKKILEEYALYNAGFPDLILWNTEKKICKFVEVKGDGDNLRPKQIIWLKFLASIGADIEVCYVKSGNKTRNQRE